MTRFDEQTPGADGHDDVAALVRASLHRAAAQTPIGASRLHEIRVSAARRPTVGWLQIAASVVAVAAIAGTVAVLQGGHSASTRSLSGGSGLPVGSSSPAVTSTITPAVSSPVLVGGSGAPTPSPSPSAGSCVPENYYVVAAPAQLTGMTYILPSAPAGFQLYGEWGTISRNNCLDSATWFVEYENKLLASNIQLMVYRADRGEPSPVSSSPPDPGWTPVSIAGHDGWFVLDKSDGSDGSDGRLTWTADGLNFQLSGPITGGKPDALLAMAESFIAVPPTDPRIVAPDNCQVPPGSVCGSDSPTPSDSPSPTSTEIPTANSTDTPTASSPVGPPPTPTPTRSPSSSSS